MVDLCHLNPLQCFHNGQCAVNMSLNMTYCQCDPCYEGTFCENAIQEQRHFDTNYIRLIIYIIGLCFSALNNGLTLELCISSHRIRRTNRGIYLIIYCILAFISSIFLVADKAVEYYSKQPINNGNQYEVFHCYVGNVGYNMLVYLCIWFSSCLTFECGLVICFDCKMSARRWRSLVTTTVIFVIAAGSVTPMLLYKCGWNDKPSSKIARGFFVWFYISGGILIYVLAILLILISFTRRVRRYGMENGSFIRTFLKLLYTHLFIFVPPISYAVGYTPFTIVHQRKNPGQAYFQCGISTEEYIIKILIEILQGVSFVITWLLFVYPSKDYMTEFYLNTWSGQRITKIFEFKFGTPSTATSGTKPSISGAPLTATPITTSFGFGTPSTTAFGTNSSIFGASSATAPNTTSFGFGAPSTTEFGTAPLELATSTYPLLQIVQYQRLNQRQICRELQNHFFSVPVPGPLRSSLKI